jgi:hypothetical protein
MEPDTSGIELVLLTSVLLLLTYVVYHIPTSYWTCRISSVAGKVELFK